MLFNLVVIYLKHVSVFAIPNVAWLQFFYPFIIYAFIDCCNECLMGISLSSLHPITICVVMLGSMGLCWLSPLISVGFSKLDNDFNVLIKTLIHNYLLSTIVNWTLLLKEMVHRKPQVLCLVLWCLAHKFQIVQGTIMELIDVLLNLMLISLMCLCWTLVWVSSHSIVI